MSDVLAFVGGIAVGYFGTVIVGMLKDRKWRAESHRRWAQKHGGGK